MILIIQGTVRDGPTGGFGGQLIANKYAWLDKTRGVSIRDFSAFDEQCPTLTASCWPRLSKTESTAEKADFFKKERKENSAIKMHKISFLDLINNNEEEEVKHYSDKISYSTLIFTDVTPVTQVVQKPKTSTVILPGKVITVTKFFGNSAPSFTLASPISSAKPIISTKSTTQPQASSAIESKIATHVKDESLNAMKLLNFMDLDVSEELNSDDNVTLNNDDPTAASIKSKLTSSSNTISSITESKPSSPLASGSFSSLSQLNSPLDADIGYNSQRHKIMEDLSNIASSSAKANNDEVVDPISVSASIEQKSINQEEEAITTSVEDDFAQKTFTVAAVPTAYTYDVVNNNLIPLF